MTTLRCAVVGDPVGHSMSPRMHAAAYRALGLDGTYEAIRATPQELPAVVARLRTGDLSGLNVTIPHKRRILDLVDEVDASARVVGAANTLVRGPDGQIVAHNTDVRAIAVELKGLARDLPPEEWKRAHTLVLGTGATARSAVVALGHHIGVGHIVVRGRSLADDDRRAVFEAEMTELLARSGSTSALSLEPWGPRPATDHAVLAIVQATSLGMEGADPGELAQGVIAWHAAQPDAIALDVVYPTMTTPFVRSARAAGMRAADGRGMLARQGALSFELWWKRPAPIDAMRAALPD